MAPAPLHTAGRAVLALSLTRDVALTRLTRTQAAKVAYVSSYNVALAAIATPAEIENLKFGHIKLSDRAKAHAHPHALSDAEVLRPSIVSASIASGL